MAATWRAMPCCYLDRSPQVCLPSHPTNTTNSVKDLSQQGSGHPHHSQLILKLPEDFNPCTHQHPTISGSADTTPWYNQTSQPRTTTTQDLVFGWAWDIEHTYSVAVQSILNQSRKDFNRRCYLATWKHFSSSLSPESSRIHVILEYLLTLNISSLSISSLWVHLATISTFHHPVENHTIFIHPVMKRFLKGVLRTFPPVVRPTSQRDLNLILSLLTKPPFKPLATCSMSHLSIKLPSQSPSQEVSKLGELMADVPYTIFHKAVSLHLHPKSIPKIMSEFHINQTIHLPIFFPKPHASDEKRQLHFLDVLPKKQNNRKKI